MGALHLWVGSASADRLAAASGAIRSCPPGHRVLIVGASRGAADDLARAVAATSPATFGLQRLSLTQLAARAAMRALAAADRTPSSWLGTEAVAARTVFDAERGERLRYFAPVAATPGFPRAVARTLQELRLSGIPVSQLLSMAKAPAETGQSAQVGSDLAALLERFEMVFDDAGSVDRARLLRLAAAEIRARAVAETAVLLDLPLEHDAERELAAAMVSSVSACYATALPDDRPARAFYASCGATVEWLASPATGDLGHLRQHLFTADALPGPRRLDGSLEFFSAPGEGRESVEIARRIVEEASRGVCFDEMAVFVRSSHAYFGLLEHAFRRAGIPAWFDRGTRRPHPTGRAFLALLSCAAEQLSAARFAEYLSLGEVPSPIEPALLEARLEARSPDAQNRPRSAWEPAGDEALASPVTRPGDDAPAADTSDEEDGRNSPGEEDRAGEDDPVVAGTLRAPWGWERLLVEAAVIGGDAGRWRRRLDGKASEIARQIAEAGREDGADGARVRALRQVDEQLQHLRSFALPVIERLAGWPRQATWGEWLDRFETLAPHVLRQPAPVLRVLADLRPMGAVGPIDLDEARRVLSGHLLSVEAPPPPRRFGRVFVATPDMARGRSFRVVFVPGLAERMFPQKPREDPLLLDEVRERLRRGPEAERRPSRADGLPLLETQGERLARERLLLQLAAGAASERLYVSYPRLELNEGRARVPSFYALDVLRAATGEVPDYEELEQRARAAGNAMLAWPAPAVPQRAIDDQEHDLAVLRRLLDEPDPGAVRGHAHYLLKLNECLRRSVIDRWARGERRWSPSDGLTRVTRHIAPALAAQRLTARARSVSALQRFSACPYQFLLAGVYRLHPLEHPEPLQRLDPLARGSLFHEIQARFLREMKTAGQLPPGAAGAGSPPAGSGGPDEARAMLDRTIDAVAAAAHDALAPAVERVWVNEIDTLRRDLHAWLELLISDGAEWEPAYFEFAFGDVPGERDASSVADDVVLEGGFKLRGAVDLIEVHRQTGVLRVTDHKTGRKPDRIERVIIDGGRVLQPVLYGLAVEAALGRAVRRGRLFYCTAAGSFTAHEIPLNEETRAAGLEVLQVIDRAIDAGFLAAAPAEEACERCEFRCVCGSDVFRRVMRKPQDRLADLVELRRRP